MEDRVSELLDRIQEVCPLSATTQRVIQLTDDPEIQLDAVAEALAVDPALAAEVMRISNSAAFGLSRKVANLEQAVAVMGLKEIHTMATAMAMLAAFSSKNELSLRLHDRSVLAGSIARKLAKLVHYPARGDAFLCGLLCEVGSMACLAVDGPGYSELWSEAGLDHPKRAELERARYGGTSREVAGKLLRRNQLPEDTAFAIETGEDEPNPGPLVCITRFSRNAAERLLDPSAQQTDQEWLSATVAEIAEQTGINCKTTDLIDLVVEAGGIAYDALRRAHGG